MRTYWSLFTRIGAQAFLALSSYLVSISAAHALSTDALALFFVGWTLESMWIGAIRMVVVPALLLHRSAPPLTVLIGVGSLAATPLVVAVLVTCRDLPIETQWLLATSVWTLGGYELARSLLSRGITNSMALPIADGGVFVLALLGVVAATLLPVSGVDAALASLSLASVLATVVIVLLLHRRQLALGRPEPLRAWLAATWPLLRLGTLEWVVFFATSTAGLALLGLLGGPRVLAGVRLAETLAAPIGLLSSALPFVVAGALRDDQGEAVRWPKAVRETWLALTAGTVLYLVLLQVLPAPTLRLLVGDHVEIAREASLGLAIGVVASVFGATATLVMKHRRQVRVLARLRFVELIVALPAVAVGASTGTATGAGLGVSASQLVPAAVQAVLHVRHVRFGKKP
jgi:hypothetical protein